MRRLGSHRFLHKEVVIQFGGQVGEDVCEGDVLTSTLRAIPLPPPSPRMHPCCRCRGEEVYGLRVASSPPACDFLPTQKQKPGPGGKTAGPCGIKAARQAVGSSKKSGPPRSFDD